MVSLKNIKPGKYKDIKSGKVFNVTETDIGVFKSWKRRNHPSLKKVGLNNFKKI